MKGVKPAGRDPKFLPVPSNLDESAASRRTTHMKARKQSRRRRSLGSRKAIASRCGADVRRDAHHKKERPKGYTQTCSDPRGVPALDSSPAEGARFASKSYPAKGANHAKPRGSKRGAALVRAPPKSRQTFQSIYFSIFSATLGPEASKRTRRLSERTPQRGDLRETVQPHRALRRASRWRLGLEPLSPGRGFLV